MRYYLSPDAALKNLEVPFVYQIKRDELYELDGASFEFLSKCAGEDGCEARESAFIDYCIEEEIITPEKTSVRRPPLLPSPRPSLRYLELQITDSCNLRCKHCYIEAGSGRELSAKQIERVLKEFERMQGLRVMITGGEPLLHSRFGEINAMLPDFAVRKVLFTNGLLLSNETIEGLNVHEVQVSIDGMKETHDSIRGDGTFSRAMDAIRRCLDAGMDVSVATMVHRGNLADFDEMEQSFKEMGIKDWTVDVPCETGRLKKNYTLRLDPSEGGKYLSYGYGGGIHGTAQGFGCGLHLMAVLSDGRVAKCTFYSAEEDSVGSIEDGIETCWKRIRPVSLSDLDCDCEFLEICRGGCRYRAELISGRGGKDLYRCAQYGII